MIYKNYQLEKIRLGFLTIGNFVAGVELRRLRGELRGSTAAAFAEGTKKNLRTQWQSFLLFCIYFNLSYLPASTDTIQLFAQFLSRSFKSVDSIRNYISGVRTFHNILGFSTDHINNYLVNLSLKGLERLNPHAVKRAEPITLAILGQIYDSLDFSRADNHVFWCLFLFAFYLVARKSNLVPTTKDDILAGKFLKVDDLEIFKDYILVSFDWSKTNQLGKRVVICPLIRMKCEKLCPVSAFEKMSGLKKLNTGGALFCTGNGEIITYYKFQKKLRECLSCIGLDAELFSTHSFRRGFTTLAFRSKVAPEHIQLLGDWKSDAYKAYLELDWTDKMEIIKSMFGDLVM